MAYPKTLIGRVASRPNLQGAWVDISQSAKPLSRGLSQQTIQDFRSNPKSHLEIIRNELLNGQYKFGQVRAVTVKKKGGKKRPLQIADIRDRVVQRAIVRKLETILENKFRLNNPASHAYLRKKGVQTAIKQMLQYHQEGCGIIFEADIVDFFGTVDTSKLLEEMIFPSLSDDTLHTLISEVFKMEVGNRNDLPEEDWELFPESSTGLPQGGYLSPLFSNVYLSAFDKKMLANKFKLIRYADDFVVMCKTREDAEKAYQLSRTILENELGLKLHLRDDDRPDAKTRIIKPTQTRFQFLGIRFNGTRIWPAPEKKQKLSYKLTELSNSKNIDSVVSLLMSTRNLLEGWTASYSFTDINRDYATKIDQEVNKHLRKALAKMKWEFKDQSRFVEQRPKSGVSYVNGYLYKARRDLSVSDRELFETYWTKDNISEEE